MSDELDTGVCFGSCVSRAVVHDEDPIDEVRIAPTVEATSVVHRARL